jgi:hypothetical protein
MANMYKMAKAFGRAAHGNSSDAAKYARQSYERDLRRYDKDPSASGRAEAFNRGSEEKFMDERNLTVDRDGRPSVEIERDERVIDQHGDARTDENMQKELSDAFDEAAERHGYDKWRKEAADKPADDGMGGEIHNVERELTEDEVRQRMIDDLKRGADISDVLEFGRGFFEK